MHLNSFIVNSELYSKKSNIAPLVDMTMLLEMHKGSKSHTKVDIKFRFT